MKIVKLIGIVMAVIITLAACAKQEVSINLKELGDTLLQNVNFQDELTQIDEKTVQILYNIENAIDEYVYISSGATAEEIALFEFQNEEDAAKALEHAKNRIAEQKADYKTYIPKEEKKLDDAIVKNIGRYLIVCVSDGNEAKNIIDTYIKSIE